MSAGDASPAPAEGDRLDFVRQIVADDCRSGKWDGAVVTRFPPEPNGYLHIGHAKAICLDFGIAREFGGRCNMRFDDTNPTKEEAEYVQAILDDVRWLGFAWDGLYYASDYFERMYELACELIDQGKAYVDDLPADQISEMRGTLTSPGQPSPYRERSVAENRDLFARMRAGEFPDGAKVLRARIDMAAPNMNLRDPVMYRIIHAAHHRQGDAWCIYPTYDWAHGLEDAIEGVTHSICTLEFENHRPLYDWYLDQFAIHHPQQIEFAPLNITYTVLSKRKLLELVTGGHVAGWDDPRMPTLRGLRRRGFSPEAIRDFCAQVGVAKYPALSELPLLEHCVRKHLNATAERRMAVLDPVRLIIDNYPEDGDEEFAAVNNPEDPAAGSRTVPFGRELWIEREDFMEDPPKKFFRLAPGREVRLRYAYLVTCTGVDKDADGRITAIHCTYDPATRGGSAPDGRKVKATLHWVAARSAVTAEVRLYETLFAAENPAQAIPEGGTWLDTLNPTSKQVLAACQVEPALHDAAPFTRFQFERKGYFCVDPDSTAGRPVFNRTVTLRDTWAKLSKAGG